MRAGPAAHEGRSSVFRVQLLAEGTAGGQRRSRSRKGRRRIRRGWSAVSVRPSAGRRPAPGYPYANWPSGRQSEGAENRVTGSYPRGTSLGMCKYVQVFYILMITMSRYRYPNENTFTYLYGPTSVTQCLQIPTPACDIMFMYFRWKYLQILTDSAVGICRYVQICAGILGQNTCRYMQIPPAFDENTCTYLQL